MKLGKGIVLILLLNWNLYSKEIPVHNPDQLIGKTMDYGFIFGSTNLRFFKDNKYQIEFGSEGWNWYNEGVFEIKNGKVLLHPKICLDSKDGAQLACNETMGEAVCTLNEDKSSLYYELNLKVVAKNKRSIFTQDPKTGDNYIVYDMPESQVKEGSNRNIDNIPVITMGLKNGIVVENVKIRKKPSIHSETVKYQAGVYGDDAAELNYVPKNTEIKVIARTVNKEKVNNWNNYWYYIKVGINHGVWAYGEFIQIK